LAERRYLSITQKIQISKDGETWFNSSIQDLLPGTFSIITPYLKGQPQIFKGDWVQVKFFKDDSNYDLETRVTDEVKDSIPLLRLAYPEQINRIQKRNHVRLPVELEVQYAPVNQAGKKEAPLVFAKASTVDISGGGMKLMVRHPIEEKEMLTLKFYLPLRRGLEHLILRALVNRCIEVDPQTQKYQLSLEFDSINRRQQDIIVRFIFEKMAVQKKLI